MYKPDDTFISPNNLDQKTWRYMDTSKFLNLIFSKKIFFSKISTLEDKYEGSLTKGMLESMNRFDENMDQINEKLYKEKNLGPVPRLQQVRALFEEARRHAYVNCWHMNEFESTAMWKLYSRQNEGIAIQSTFSLLRDSFMNTSIDVNIGVVEYKDFDRDTYNKTFFGELNKPFVLKRKSFTHEQEIRAIILGMTRQSQITSYYSNGGLGIDIDLIKLIQKVYVAPASPNWYRDNVQMILDKAEIDVKVVKSDLDKDPLF